MNFNFKLKLIDQYLFRQVLITTLIGMILFIVIWVSPEILFKIVRRVVGHECTIIQGIRDLILEIPLVLGKAIPMGLLLGCLGVFDSLSKNFELITLRSVGVSFKRLLMPVLLISVVFSVLSFITFDKLIPYSRKILDADEGGINQQFVYVDKDENDRPEQIIIVSNYDGKNIHNVSSLGLSSKNDIRAPLLQNIYLSPYAVNKENSILLVDGLNYKLNNNNIFNEISHFNSVNILQDPKAKAFLELMDFSVKRDRNLTNAELTHYLKLLKQEGMQEEYRTNLNKYYQRFYDSISCIFLAVLGCILGYSRPREHRLLGYTAAVGVIFLYYIIIPLLDLLAQKGVLFPIIAAGVPCFIVIAAIFVSLKLKNLDIVK